MRHNDQNLCDINKINEKYSPTVYNINIDKTHPIFTNSNYRFI